MLEIVEGHVLIVSFIDAEEHLKDRNDYGKREQRQESREYIEQYVECEVLLIGRYEALYDSKKLFHSTKLMIFLHNAGKRPCYKIIYEQ